MIGEGPSARSVKLDLPPSPWSAPPPAPVCSPIRCVIASASSRASSSIPGGVDLDRQSLGTFAESGNERRWRPRNRAALARHTRIANRLLRRVRDFAEVKRDGKVDRRSPTRR